MFQHTFTVVRFNHELQHFTMSAATSTHEIHAGKPALFRET